MKKHGFYRRNGRVPHSRLVRSLISRSAGLRIRLGKPLAVSLALLSVGIFHARGISLLSLVQQAAVLSAALAMPEAGLGQIQERYQDALSLPEEVVYPPSAGAPSSSAPFIQPLPTDFTIDLPPDAPLEEGEISSQGSEAPGESDEVLASSGPEPSISLSAPGSDLSPVYKITGNPMANRYIPPENRGTILSQTFDAPESPIYIQFGQGKIKNSTSLTNAQAEEVLDVPCSIGVDDLSQPTVLIYHTHATEAYEPFDSEYFDKTYNWRSDDNDKNMVAVGTALAQKLEQAGIGVVHIEEQHDNPSYNGAYDKSAQTIREALEQYPTIQVILDIHRDAIQRDPDTIVKAVADIDGRKAAQLMIIAGCDDNGSLGMPQWKENFRFSAALQDILETMYPGLCRPVFFCYRKYNMDLCPNGALIEIGSHGNTLEEAQYTAELLGNALIVLLQGQI